MRRYSKIPLNVRFDEVILEEMEKHAFRTGKSVSQIVRESVISSMAKIFKQNHDTGYLVGNLPIPETSWTVERKT